jgi:PAS domain S-box-containing protein
MKFDSSSEGRGILGGLPTSRTGMLIESLDWGATAVGPMESWPEALLATTRLLLATHVPMVMLMGEKGVLIYNESYAVFAGNRHPGLLGMEVADGWPEIAQFNLDILGKVLAGETLSLKRQKLDLNRYGTMEEVWLDLDYSPVPDSNGRPIAELVIVREITDRVAAEVALERSEENLSLTLAASGAAGIWDWHIADDKVVADANFAQMFGVSADLASRGLPLAAYVQGVHPDDRPQLQERIEAVIGGAGEFRAEYRITSSDGIQRWVLAVGRAMRDEAGNVVRLPGVVVDITERKRQEQALAVSEAGFRALADSMPQMVWSTRADGFHDYYNARWYEYTGVPAGTTDGEGWNDMFHPDDREKAWELWRRSLKTGEPYQIEYRLRHHSGEYRWTLGRALPVRDEHGRITRWFGTCTDIHAQRLATEEREVIAQELSHRIKNIFSVLTGIIGLSARSSPQMKPFADQLRARIAAMGKAHDFVRPHSQSSKPSESQHSLKALVSQLVGAFQSDDNERVRFEGDDATVDEAAATPIALLIHELATNAAKYGALSRPAGTVVLEGRREGDVYRLVWRERGADLGAEVPGADGFGSRLISLSVEGQLGGKMSRTWSAEGLTVDVEVPLGALSRTARLRAKSR